MSGYATLLFALAMLLTAGAVNCRPVLEPAKESVKASAFEPADESVPASVTASLPRRAPVHKPYAP